MFVKLAGISSVLAAIFVVALEVPAAQSRTPVKVYVDRAPTEAAPTAPVRHASAKPAKPATASDAPRVVPVVGGQSDCRRQAWPYQDPNCGSAERRPVRTITIERREGMNASNLIRLPFADQ